MIDKKGQRLKEIRELENESQLEMAEKLGCSQAYLSAMESGVRQVSANISAALAAKYSKYSMDFFYFGRGKELYRPQGEPSQGGGENVKVDPYLQRIAILEGSESRQCRVSATGSPASTTRPPCRGW